MCATLPMRKREEFLLKPCAQHNMTCNWICIQLDIYITACYYTWFLFLWLRRFAPFNAVHIGPCEANGCFVRIAELTLRVYFRSPQLFERTMCVCARCLSSFDSLAIVYFHFNSSFEYLRCAAAPTNTRSSDSMTCLRFIAAYPYNLMFISSSIFFCSSPFYGRGFSFTIAEIYTYLRVPCACCASVPVHSARPGGSVARKLFALCASAESKFVWFTITFAHTL